MNIGPPIHLSRPTHHVNISLGRRVAGSDRATLSRFPLLVRVGIVPEPAIDREVHRDHQQPKQDLDFSCEAGGVECRQEILYQGVGRGGGFSRLRTQPMFQRREGAGSAGAFDDRAPGGSRLVQPGDPAPHRHEEPAEQDEGHECQVKNENQRGQEGIHHGIRRG